MYSPGSIIKSTNQLSCTLVNKKTMDVRNNENITLHAHYDTIDNTQETVKYNNTVIEKDMSNDNQMIVVLLCNNIIGRLPGSNWTFKRGHQRNVTAETTSV